MDLSKELENLNEYLRTLDISAETNKINMAEAQQVRELVMQNIKLIQPFDGDANYLALYVDSIDSIMPVVAPTQRAERAFYFNCILRTLRGAALDIIRREQPSDWSTLRELLIDEFGEHTPISTLILQISNIKFKEMDVEEIRNNPQSVRSVITANAASATPIAAPRRQQSSVPPVREAGEEHFEEYVPPRCSLCRRPHFLKKCTIFKTMTPAQRQQIARAHGHCMTCLADTHATMECMSDGSCQYCHRPHHTLFHRFPRRADQSAHTSHRHNQQRHSQRGNQVQRRRAHRAKQSRGARLHTPPQHSHRNQRKATGSSAVVSTLQKLQRLLGN
ncbi:uncharacterized protein LOC126765284 [Bactrocera neohumeralis]|uniref:uncharacterized protein LOC126765284 n=1 Tax=Bactrocera neohumeralis TaxID=98809 RepID=UPI0021659E7D|nr:uncharacterized protein LOC126765284 [Bactrocera neohumeralis]